MTDALQDNGEYLKIPDGVSLADLIGTIATSSLPAKGKLRMIPDVWGDGRAELRFNHKRDGSITVEITALGRCPDPECDNGFVRANLYGPDVYVRCPHCGALTRNADPDAPIEASISFGGDADPSGS